MAFVGIDLGTTTSEIAIYEDSGPRIVKDSRGDEIVDSYFGFDPKTKNPIVGSRVRAMFQSDPELAVGEVKRQMGDDVELQVGDQTYTPPEISAHILRHLKQSAEEQLDEDVDRCVITVPANFPDPARRATQQAGEIAGMKVARIINEPTAAALAYGHAEGIEEEHVMVYDLGGGTFDVSIVEYMGDVLDILASSGDPDWEAKTLMPLFLTMSQTGLKTSTALPSKQTQATTTACFLPVRRRRKSSASTSRHPSPFPFLP